MRHSVLIIGLGSIGERHLRCFQRSERARLWLCEPNDELRQRMESQYRVDRSSAALDSFLDSPPDAAVICTPAPLHVPIAIQLAKAGVNLLIEKPLSTSLDGVSELARISEAKRLTVGLAYVLRVHPALSELRGALQSGKFGQPQQLVFNSGQNFPFYRPAYREIYYASRESGGGAIQDALTHGINASEWLVGPVTELAADAEHQLLEGVEVEDTVHVIARHEHVLANYSLNQYQAPNETSLTVACEYGTLRWQLHHARWLWQSSPNGEWTLGGQAHVERDDLFVMQAHAFLDAIEGKQLLHCTLDAGIQTLRAMLAILRAVDERRWVSLKEEETQNA